MLSCLAALCILGAMGCGFLVFIRWVIGEHQKASLYRQLENMRSYAPIVPPPAAIPGWIITYKNGKRTESKRFTCDKETDAIAEILKTGVGPRDIVSSVRT